ncbi:MAG TPA: ribosome-associated translation inhibitor RaiA [Ruminococcaceae bacterium]|jgi:putative sigma-54 modulation protein|nr:ribosome-associated translation inhibitor RaiA [Oscillospiraceae bacterium]HCB90803.1 ribosome-associated translation inhibitor RaiA [Oscillospiraceae bacterium]
MKVTFIGRKVNLRDHFKALATKKLARFDRIFGSDASAKVVVTLERNRQTVEITIRSHGMLFRAEATSDEMNTALDMVLDALGSQIRKNKARLDKRIHGAALRESASEEEEGQEDYKVVRTKRFPVKPMSVEEAILQMNLLEHRFFMFRNQNSGEVNVIYQRKNGGYGLLEPEDL